MFSSATFLMVKAVLEQKDGFFYTVYSYTARSESMMAIALSRSASALADCHRTSSIRSNVPEPEALNRPSVG